MKLKINRDNTVDINTRNMLAFCLACGKRIGSTNYFKDDAETDITHMNMMPLCAICFSRYVGKTAMIYPFP